MSSNKPKNTSSPSPTTGGGSSSGSGGGGGGRNNKKMMVTNDSSHGGSALVKPPTTPTTSASQQQQQQQGGGAAAAAAAAQTTSQQSERSVDRDPFFSNRDTVDFKWQRSSKNIVGALEVDSEPVFNPRRELKPRYRPGCEEKFHDALQAWEDLKLKQSFRKACAGDELQTELCCCGFLEDPEATKKQYVKQLNDGWIKTTANKKLASRGFKVDAFLWTWQNASGKSETNIVLLRFYILSTFAFRRASDQGSLDLDNILSSDDDEKDEDNDNDDDNDDDKTKPVKLKEMAR